MLSELAINLEPIIQRHYNDSFEIFRWLWDPHKKLFARDFVLHKNFDYFMLCVRSNIFVISYLHYTIRNQDKIWAQFSHLTTFSNYIPFLLGLTINVSFALYTTIGYVLL